MNIEELQKEAELTISHGVRYLRRDHAEAILKLIAVARAARRLADLADEHLSRFPKADMPELFDLRLTELEDMLDTVED